MVPCCGHDMYLDPDDPASVLVPGCRGGVDWRTTHQGGTVELETRSGSKAVMSFDRGTVLRFVREVEGFYGSPDNKISDGDEYFRKAFERFWLEWDALKAKWS